MNIHHDSNFFFLQNPKILQAFNIHELINVLGTYFSKIWIEVQNIFFQEKYKEIQWLIFMVFICTCKNFNIWIIYFIDKDTNDI